MDNLEISYNLWCEECVDELIDSTKTLLLALIGVFLQMTVEPGGGGSC